MPCSPYWWYHCASVAEPFDPPELLALAELAVPDAEPAEELSTDDAADDPTDDAAELADDSAGAGAADELESDRPVFEPQAASAPAAASPPATVKNRRRVRLEGSHASVLSMSSAMTLFLPCRSSIGVQRS